jgi:hypothetical protein
MGVNKRGERPLIWKLYTIQERNQRRLQKIERSPMLMDRQSQHFENVLTTKRKDWQMGLHEIKKLLNDKRNGL